MLLTLFKYVGLQHEDSWQRLEDLIAKNHLAPSRANTFNDPFDVSPVTVDDLTEDDAKEFLESEHGKAFAKNSGHTTDELLEDIKAFSGRVSSAISTIQPSTDVVCLSANISSPLLWAHYASGYKGACLMFTPGQDSILKNPLKVEYSDQRPLLPLSVLVRRAAKDRSSKEFNRLNNEFVRLQFGIKSTDWSYEQEYRVASLHEAKKDWTILQTDFRGIIFGPLTATATKDRVKELLQKHSRTIRLFEAELSKTEYSMNVNWSSHPTAR